MFSKMMCSCVFLANVASHASCGAPSNAGFPWYGGANDFENVRHTWCNSFIRDAMDDIRKVMDGVNDKFTEQQNGMKKQLIDVLSELLSKRVQDARQVLIENVTKNINTQMGLLEKETKEELDKKISDLFQEFRSHSTSEIAGSNSRNDSRKVIYKEISDRISHPQSTDDKIIELIYNDLEKKNENGVKDDNREQDERRMKNDEEEDTKRIIIEERGDDEDEQARAPLADELKKITASSSVSDLEKMLEGRGDEEIKSNMDNIVKAVNACMKFTGKETELKIREKKLLDITSHKGYLEAEKQESLYTIIDGKIKKGELEEEDVKKICKGLIANQQEKEESGKSGDIESLAQLTDLIGQNDTAILEDEEIKKAVTSAIKTIVTNINDSNFNNKLRAVLKELAKAGGITDHEISDNELGKLIEERMICTGYEWEVDTKAGKMSTGSENYDIAREIPGQPKSEGQTMLKGRKLVKAQKSDLERTIALGESGEIKNTNAAKKMIGVILKDTDYRKDLQTCEVTDSYKKNEGGTITIKLGSVTHTIKIDSPTMSEKSFKKLVRDAKKYPEHILKGELNKIASDSDGTYTKQYYAAKATTK